MPQTEEFGGTVLVIVSNPIRVTEEDARSLLVGAVEGGSNYWIDKIRYVFGEGLDIEDFRKGGKHADPGGVYFHPTQLVPFVEGCGLVLENEEKEVSLNLESMRRGFQVMAEKYPRHWQDFVNKDYDSTTSDVWLQCCVFGELIFS